MGNIPALAAGKQAFRRLRLECEPHSASQSGARTIHIDKKEQTTTRVDEVWRYSPLVKIFALAVYKRA